MIKNIKLTLPITMGQERVHSKFQVIVMSNEESKVCISSDSAHSYDMDVIAERINRNAAIIKNIQ